MFKTIDIIEQAARAGGKILTDYFGKELEVTEKKTTADLLTKADTEAEEAILTVLHEHFPSYNYLTEEQGENHNGSEYTFVIDPLDGSNNFVMGLPYFSVAIGLIHDDEVTDGVVFNPVLNHLYAASANEGIQFNGKKLRVNAVSELERTTVLHVANYQTWPKQVSEAMRVLGKHNIKRVLNTWSPALDFCLLATGMIEAVSCFVTAQDEFYDYAIGKFIAQEGGAKITKLDGTEDYELKNGVFLASNGTAIHAKLLELLPKTI